MGNQKSVFIKYGYIVFKITAKSTQTKPKNWISNIFNWAEKLKKQAKPPNQTKLPDFNTKLANLINNMHFDQHMINKLIK